MSAVEAIRALYQYTQQNTSGGYLIGQAPLGRAFSTSLIISYVRGRPVLHLDADYVGEPEPLPPTSLIVALLVILSASQAADIEDVVPRYERMDGVEFLYWRVRALDH